MIKKGIFRRMILGLRMEDRYGGEIRLPSEMGLKTGIDELLSAVRLQKLNTVVQC